MASDVPDQIDRRKAAYLAAYKRLCRRFGLMVAMQHREDYSPFILVRVDDDLLEQACREMLIEPVIRASTDPPKENPS